MADSKVWYVSPTGEKKVVDTGLQGATGITTSVDGWLLFVADGRSHWVYSYQINADGTLSNKQRFYWLHVADDADQSGAEGLCVDREGRLFTATPMGIQISGLQGHLQGIIAAPSAKISAICFGGPNFDVLYAACGDKVFQRKLKVKGANIFQDPIKPPPTKL
jgi:sugar lactone lactonase YvrE